MRKIAVGIVGWSIGLVFVGETTAQLPPSQRYLPQVLKYDLKSDTFTYRDSVNAPLLNKRRTRAEGLYGNRLTQFRYLGPPGTGGIYDALDDYKLRLELDPGNYKYRSLASPMR